MKRSCELCSDPATMYCESDTASLCLTCDEKVHGANFLVAKHERSLLCSVCQSVTSWKASGPKLGRTVSVCDACVCSESGGGGKFDPNEVEDDQLAAVEEVESRDRSGGYDDPDASSDDEPDASSDDEDDEDEDDEIQEDEDDDDEENQVVPWSSGEEVSSSCSGGGESGRKLKRRRAVSDLDSDGEMDDGDGSRSRTTQWYRCRTTNWPVGLNRFPDRNMRELEPTRSAIRAWNQTSRRSG